MFTGVLVTEKYDQILTGELEDSVIMQEPFLLGNNFSNFQGFACLKPRFHLLGFLFRGDFYPRADSAPFFSLGKHASEPVRTTVVDTPYRGGVLC